MHRARLIRLALLLAAAGAGCESHQPARLAEAAPGASLQLPPVKPLPGIENYRRLSAKIAQGGQPNGAASFAALKAEGITTILSVDGAAPDVAGAEAAGLHYVHVPIGYDGVSADAQARIIKAVEDSAGPVYIHCHHGQHRGPAAAAVAREAVDGVGNDEAVAELKASGCSPSYPGLFRDVQNWKAPSAATLAAVGPLPSAVKPGGVRDVMVHVDQRMDLIKACRAARWATPPQSPDVVPADEVTIVYEAFRELQRLPAAQAKGADFLAHAKAAEDATAALRDAVSAKASDKAEAAFGAFTRTCDACHTTYRN
jgi:protein tyrosine phosphatase (PTP) superfamily phosphohydrolase (DUF442 family)